MRHLIEDDGSAMSGFGDIAEVHEGPDGNLYEWVEGLSAWGEPIGYWQGLSEVPVGARGVGGLGALYQASDGSLYQMHGLGEEEKDEAKEADGDADEKDEGPPKMGPGRPGEIRVGPNGKRYRWVMGVGPGGKRTGFWRHLRHRPAPQGVAPGPHARPGSPAAPPHPGARPPASGGRKKKPFLKRLLPLAKVAASLIPFPGAGAAVKAGLNVADKLLTKKKGVAGYDGLGALYQAPDGSLYQVHGIAEDELHGFYETDGIDGVAAGDDLNGLAREEDMHGVSDDGDMRGYAEAPERGIGANDLEGYVRDGSQGLEAYVRETPPQTRMFEPGRPVPDPWKPLW